MKPSLVPSLIVLLTALPTSAGRPDLPPALDEGFRIASAIQSDPKDRGMAQESVVLDMAEAGALDEAVARADQIEGWRQGVAYAEIARLMARTGRLSDAKALVAKADGVRAGIEGWEASRIEAHAGQARALVGLMEQTENAAGRLVQEDALQYAGLPAIVRASSQAARGELDAALATLQESKETGLEMAWWRTTAFLELARHSRATAEQRRRALEAAREDAVRLEEILSRLDALERVGQTAADMGLGDLASSVLEESYPVIIRMPDSTVLKGAYLAGQARILVRLGRPDPARERLTLALQVTETLGALERPAILANIAGGYQALGDTEETSRVLNLALAGAESLVNARPRALAAVEICRASARFDLPWNEPTASRMAGLRKGLKAPW